MPTDDILSSLHPLERKVLPHVQRQTSVSEIMRASGMHEVEVLRACQWLQAKGILLIKEAVTEQIVLGPNGEKYLKQGLPERRFLSSLVKEMQLQDVQKASGLAQDEIAVCLGLLKKKQAIVFTAGKVIPTQEGKALLAKTWPEESLLAALPKELAALTAQENEAFTNLSSRKEIVSKRPVKSYAITPTPFAKELGKLDLKTEFLESVTPDLLRSKAWKGKQFRRYDLSQKIPKSYPAREHPLNAVLDMVREIFIEMGFQEMEGPWVETAFWCMDSMWIPQDHPAREVQDTFYLPGTGDLPDKKLVDKVIASHHHGGTTGSKGYGYAWNPELAKQLLLRTHTTATTFRYFGEKHIKAPAKYFYIGRIFRNEAMDATHLSEFHQVEGFVMGEGLTLRHLQGFIREFYAKMGIHKIRFKPTYNPYTEPSMEALYFDEKRGRWLELINSGIFRPEALEPYGITQPVIAWGLGVERLAKILYETAYLKDFIGAGVDFEFMKRYPLLHRRDE